MTYPEALRYLDSFINYEKRSDYDYKRSFKIDRMRRMASLLGSPQNGTKSIHVAGTKGKGSTAAFIYHILMSAGFSVGLYTSPHLVSFRERIRINNRLINKEDVGRLLDAVRAAACNIKDDEPTFFEVYTSLAYLYFKERRVDFAVYEAGLGGRLDATNIIESLVCAITPISYEHTQLLGPTLREIAFEKGGIIKDKGICVSAPQEKEALETLERIAKERGARLVIVGRDILFEEVGSCEERQLFNIFSIFNEYPRLETRLLGSHQVINAATAIGVVEALRFHGVTIPSEAIRDGISCADWQGRLEVVRRKPFVILDGAQNRASAEALACAIKKSFNYRDLILVLGVSKDKDINGILDALAPISKLIISTKSNVVERALDPNKISSLAMAKGREAIMTSSVEEALALARSEARAKDMILVTGSLFVVGQAREILIDRNHHPWGVTSLTNHTPGAYNG